MTNSGLFLNIGKMEFFGFVFQTLMLLFFFVKCFKNDCFPQLEGLVAFVFLVFAFLFGVGFVSVCLLCVVLWLDAVVPGSVFFVFVCLFVCFFCLFFCFFGRFKGQVRWPKGPPHLALNPPCFLFVFLFLLFFCLLFVCFFGGFKGQVRWPKGPPHLALNPPSIFCFFWLGSCCFVFLSLL